MWQVGVYCLLSLVTIFFAEAYPLLLVAPISSGGLGWSASQVGALLATAGFFLAASNFLLFPLLAKRLRTTTLFRIAITTLTTLYATTPLLARAAPSPTLLGALLLVHQALCQSCQSTAFTAIFLIINNSCVASQRGRVNGLAMAISSGFKAAGPMLGAVSFAWSLTNGCPPPFDVHFTFLLCALGVAGTAATAWWGLTPDNDRPLPPANESGAPPTDECSVPPANEEDDDEGAPGEASSSGGVGRPHRVPVPAVPSGEPVGGRRTSER